MRKKITFPNSLKIFIQIFKTNCHLQCNKQTTCSSICSKTKTVVLTNLRSVKEAVAMGANWTLLRGSLPLLHTGCVEKKKR